MLSKMEKIASIDAITWRSIRQHLLATNCSTAAENFSRELDGSADWSDDWSEEWETDDEDETEPSARGRTGDGGDDYCNETGAGDADLLNLQSCLVACSPCLDVLVFCYQQRFISLGLTLHPLGVDALRTVIFGRGEIGSSITCVVCLPVASAQRSATIPYDWTCLLLGTETGECRFYTADSSCRLLFCQKFASAAVRSVDLYYGTNRQQELSILHNDGVLVTLDALQLFTALKTARNQVLTKGLLPDKVAEIVSLKMSKKWCLHSAANFAAKIEPPALQSDRMGAGHASLGAPSLDPISQMISGSMLGGFKATISKNPPHGSLVSVTAGPPSSPFVSFHWGAESSAGFGFSDVLGSLAGKVKSAVKGPVSSFSNLSSLGAGLVTGLVKGSGEGGMPAEEIPATEMSLRYLIYDLGRSGNQLFSLPGSSMGLSAVADNRARVCLVNSVSGCLIRMWKGFREAQCGFLEISGEVDEVSLAEFKESTNTSPQQKQRCCCTFIVMYAPRKGVVEMYPAQQGSRIDAFKVSHKGRLLQLSPHHILGPTQHRSRPISTIHFLNPDGSIHQFTVPFHMALRDESSQSQHDTTIVKELKRSLIGLSSESVDLTEVTKLLGQLKTPQSLDAVLDLIVSQSGLRPHLMDVILEQCGELCQKMVKRRSHLAENSDLLRFAQIKSTCLQYRNLVNLFVLAESVTKSRPSSPSEESGLSQAEMADLLGVKDDQLEKYMRAINECLKARAERTLGKTVSYQLTLCDFIGCFDVGDRSTSTGHFTSTELTSNELVLRPDISDVTFSRLADYLMKPLLCGDFIQVQTRLIPVLRFSIGPLSSLFCSAWLSRAHLFSIYPPHVRRVFLHILRKDDFATSMIVAENVFEKELLQATLLPEAFGLAIIFRSVLMAVSKTGVDNRSDGYELVDELQEKWDCIVDMFYRLIPLATLQYQLEPVMGPSLSFRHRDTPKLCLSAILKLRKGALAEYVSISIADYDHDNELISMEQIMSLYEASSRDDENKLSGWRSNFLTLQRSFPLSLLPDTLLANCAIKFGSNWDRNPENVDSLRACYQCVREIANPVLQHGIVYLVWTAHLNLPFKQLVFLVEKVGKFPKDRLCRKEIGFGETRVVDFVSICVDMLEVFLEANSLYEATSPGISEGSEDFLENFWELYPPSGEEVDRDSSSPRQLPLCDLAVKQKCTNYHLVKHHWHLALVLKLMLEVMLKPAKPLSLFDKKGKDAFFLHFYAMPLLPLNTKEELDTRTQVARGQFFQAYVASLLANNLPYPPICEEAEDRVSQIQLPNLSQAFQLCKEWNMESDLIWMYCILELYSMGYDYLAERQMYHVENKAGLGSELLLLAGRRLSAKLSDQSDSLAKSNAVLLLSPTMKTWLKTMDTDRLHFTDNSLSSVRKILRYAKCYLPDSHAERIFVDQLLELVEKCNV